MLLIKKYFACRYFLQFEKLVITFAEWGMKTKAANRATSVAITNPMTLSTISTTTGTLNTATAIRKTISDATTGMYKITYLVCTGLKYYIF